MQRNRVPDLLLVFFADVEPREVGDCCVGALDLEALGAVVERRGANVVVEAGEEEVRVFGRRGVVDGVRGGGEFLRVEVDAEAVC